MAVPSAVQGGGAFLHCLSTAPSDSSPGVRRSLQCSAGTLPLRTHTGAGQPHLAAVTEPQGVCPGNRVPGTRGMATLPSPSRATFVQVFIILGERCQARVLVAREAVAVQAGRPGLPLAQEHGGAAGTDRGTHAPAGLDEPVCEQHRAQAAQG